MDDLERLIDDYRRRASSSVASRLDVLMAIEQVRDPGVAPFLVTLLEDHRESDEVKALAVQQLRCRVERLHPHEVARVANAIGNVMVDPSSPQLQLQAALALGEFTKVAGVLRRLNHVCLAQDESIDLRYAAFTSLERAGPTAESIALLRQMTGDETLGRSARSVLSAWHVERSQ